GVASLQRLGELQSGHLLRTEVDQLWIDGLRQMDHPARDGRVFDHGELGHVQLAEPPLCLVQLVLSPTFWICNDGHRLDRLQVDAATQFDEGLVGLERASLSLFETSRIQAQHADDHTSDDAQDLNSAGRQFQLRSWLCHGGQSRMHPLTDRLRYSAPVLRY